MATSVCVTKLVACLGITLSCLALAPVLYTHLTHRDHSTLLPWLASLQVGDSSTEQRRSMECGV